MIKIKHNLCVLQFYEQKLDWALKNLDDPEKYTPGLELAKKLYNDSFSKSADKKVYFFKP